MDSLKEEMRKLGMAGLVKESAARVAPAPSTSSATSRPTVKTLALLSFARERIIYGVDSLHTALCRQHPPDDVQAYFVAAMSKARELWGTESARLPDLPRLPPEEEFLPLGPEREAAVERLPKLAPCAEELRVALWAVKQTESRGLYFSDDVSFYSRAQMVCVLTLAMALVHANQVHTE